MSMPFGESHYNSKLTESDVVEIRKKLAKPCKCCKRKFTLKMIAKEYGVSAITIFKINNGEIWKHV